MRTAPPIFDRHRRAWCLLMHGNFHEAKEVVLVTPGPKMGRRIYCFKCQVDWVEFKYTTHGTRGDL
jgi:hypothetical protein